MDPALADERSAERGPAGQGAGQLAGARLIDPRAPLAAQDIRDTVLIKCEDLFLLSDLHGNVPGGNRNGLGLYHGDTRVLSGLELVVEGLPPTILLSTEHGPDLSEQVLTNPHLASADGHRIDEQTVAIRRYRRIMPRSVREALAFDNLNTFPIVLDIAVHLEADFADMFEVRGLVAQAPRPVQLLVEEGRLLRFRCQMRDGSLWETTVTAMPPPAAITGGTLRYQVALEPRASRRVTIVVQAVPGSTALRGAPGETRPRQRVDPARASVALRTSSPLLDAILRRAREDLQVLASGDIEGEADDGAGFLAAGVPWYAALFGRDSILAALAQLWLDPALARRTLRLLAQWQGTRDDPWRDEEPGKILHEQRRGELARAGVLPFDRYYGTVDATPLWVRLLGEYYRTTGDLALVRELRPHLEAALRWCDERGDLDGDGFLEYRRRSASGLVNQGWKDSWDAIVHADGALAAPPIALVEAQGYLYAARREAARLFRALAEPDRAQALDQAAEALRAAFERAFWVEEEGFYALALDGDKRPASAITSNPGHALWCGIVSAERAPRVAERLLEEDLFSGWGIRTLSTRSPRFNPAGYHVGSVWPHDNAIAVLGLKRYGEDDRAQMVADALLAAAHRFPSYRLPELFCGFARSAFGVPVRYPVACSPQAWAATSPGALLQAVLGIVPDAWARELRIVRPRLPEGIEWLSIERLPVGAAQVDLRYQRVGDHVAVDVITMRGDVRVVFADRWE